jgi:hypothetical protein
VLPIEKRTTPEDNKSTSSMTIPGTTRIYAEGRSEGNSLKISRGNEEEKKKKKRKITQASGIHTKGSCNEDCYMIIDHRHRR